MKLNLIWFLRNLLHICYIEKFPCLYALKGNDRLTYIIDKNVVTTRVKIIRNLHNRPEYIEELLSAILVEHVLDIEIVDF